VNASPSPEPPQLGKLRHLSEIVRNRAATARWSLPARLWALAALDAEGYTHSIPAAAVAALKAQNAETDKAADKITRTHQYRVLFRLSAASCPTRTSEVCTINVRI
jgi:hypothetical protein